MPEEMRVQGPGPNGNGFLVDLKERKLGLTGPNVALLLLILIIGGVAYIRTGTIDKTMKAGQEQIAGTEDRVHKRVDALFSRMDKLIDDLAAQNIVLNQNKNEVTSGQADLRNHVTETMHAQAALVHTQTEAIAALVHKQTEYVEKWFTEIGQRLEVLNFNIQHPERTLPLRSPLPPEERQPERGR